MIRFGDGSKYMSMKYDAAGRLLRRTTRVSKGRSFSPEFKINCT